MLPFDRKPGLPPDLWRPVVVAVLVGFVAVSILMAVFNLTSGLNV